MKKTEKLRASKGYDGKQKKHNIRSTVAAPTGAVLDHQNYRRGTVNSSLCRWKDTWGLLCGRKIQIPDKLTRGNQGRDKARLRLRATREIHDGHRTQHSMHRSRFPLGGHLSSRRAPVISPLELRTRQGVCDP